METFTQPKITGYRQLTEHEAQLMDRFKITLAAEMQASLAAASAHVLKQRASAVTEEESKRVQAAEPERWIAIARTHFQEGLMALTRAVAQPGSF